jgi:DNA-directed RNA polymerase subunit M/transcription elongation factor TFIIS
MYYIAIDERNPNNLNYYCRFCGHKDEKITEDGMVVLKTQFKKSEQKFNHMVNKYTKYDPTLPRKNNMKCPNADCTTTHEPDIIYLRYDDENMKYLYICANCDFTWKTDDNK